MNIIIKSFCVALIMFFATAGAVQAADTVEEYIREFPNQEQVKMMHAWLEKNEKGTFQFTGLVDPTDSTVVTPQATVNYGYNWFSVSDDPAIVKTPKYDKFFSVSIFDMKHNVPAVIVNPDKPILIKRPGQKVPDGDFHVVSLETDQGVILTRMVVVDNLKEVMGLSKKIVMEGGRGSMVRNVQRFSAETEKNALSVIDAIVSYANPDVAFGEVSGDVSFLNLAAGVKLGQLGTPADTVRYGIMLTDDKGQALNGKDTYVVTVPAGLHLKGGYYSVTLYGADNQLLIPNDKKIYDRTTFSSKANVDGSYTLTFSPDGEGINGIPTGKAFYGVLRAYVPNPDANMKVKVVRQ
ncbi:DUF1214 domain-containing protein [Marinobacter sp. DY40_1A1]|uniref:DUF1214 domain-containing protein n=1 Tax=Marinobacter sp. DY40_1A1 TaxID=2583229 RepID=UPI0019073DB9|nr:DUF1214 domain-containing protein [Marinobacter sp. DY40_1A1]MBK1887674.1 DUF1214 domain-containing protein [Marinobacter sp. DY40_1A1]